MTTFVFDLDGTLCFSSTGEYKVSKPYKERIEHINSLYDSGHKIVIYTARGMGRTDNDAQKASDLFLELTTKQLKEWGVKYHKLFMGKPAGEIYIDDLAMSAWDYFIIRLETFEKYNKLGK